MSTENTSRPTVAIVGASRDRGKYGNRSVRAHVAAGYAVYPINPQAETIEGLPAYRSLAELPLERVDRISLYLPPEVGRELLPQMLRLQPGEVWLNPGAESPALVAEALALGLPVIEACSIVDANLRRAYRVGDRA